MQDDVTSNSTVSGTVPLYNPVPIYTDANGTLPVSKAPVCVSYKIAVDKSLSQVVDSGSAYTSSDVDYTLKVRRREGSRCLVETDGDTVRLKRSI